LASKVESTAFRKSDLVKEEKYDASDDGIVFKEKMICLENPKRAGYGV
jgi:hypothetical protein